MSSFDELILKLDYFIRKYYKNLLIKGLIYSLTLLFIFFLAVVLIEYFGNFGTAVRSILFYSYLFFTGLILVYYIFIPLSKLYRLSKIISYEEAAVLVGRHFKEIQDKILNSLQLNEQKENINPDELDLLAASIEQKTDNLKKISFTNAINYKENLKYLKRFFLVIGLLFIISLFDYTIVFSSAERILNYSEETIPNIPFHFKVDNELLYVLEQEDYKLSVTLSGKEIPENIYIIINQKQHLLKKNSSVSFEYLFRNVQVPLSFFLSDGKYESSMYTLNTIPKPSLQEFKIYLSYPEHTGLINDSLKNIGDLIIPEGTKVNWKLITKNVDTLNMSFQDTSFNLSPIGLNYFKINKKIYNSQEYSIISKNILSDFYDSTGYSIDVIKDKKPLIIVDEIIDSSYSLLRYFNGGIEDDYGFTKLLFYYKLDSWINYKSSAIPLNKSFKKSSFYHFFDFSSLEIPPGASVTYFFEIWDNDMINGPKKSTSQRAIYNAPTEKEINELSKENSSHFKKELDNSIKEAYELTLEMQKIKKEILDKNKLDWQDHNRIESFINKQKKFQEKISNLNKQNKSTTQEINHFNEMSKEIITKQEQLNKLFDDLMNDEMKALYDELQKLMKEMNKKDILNNLEEIELTQEDMLKELDRSLEQFKQLEFDENVENIMNKLSELAEKQEKLSKETLEKKSSNFELSKSQEDIKNDFYELQYQIDDLKKLNEELENKHQIPKMDSEEENIINEMKESTNKLEENKNKKASESQKKASEQLKSMAEKMQQMQMNSESIELDMKALRQLLENLVDFSFDQESIINELKKLSTRDPKYVKIGQNQQKLQDDLKIIEDSLFALSKRVVVLGPHINKEVLSMKRYVNKSIKYITERQTSLANSNQQYVMTSANNLALLLDEVLQQMQQSLPGSGQCNKPGGSNPSNGDGMKNSIESMKKQIEKMKKALEKGGNPGGEKSGNSNSPSSESLARIAAHQAALRKQLNELSQQLNKDGSSIGNGLKKIEKKLENIEKEIINNQMDQQTLFRQEQILTKMLEHEKAIREQEMENKRESKEIKVHDFSNPNQFDEYKRKKEKELELLKTIPPSLKPYYKNKVNEYFNHLQY